jgi:ABC-2 type transport system ATP-binding protein
MFARLASRVVSCAGSGWLSPWSAKRSRLREVIKDLEMPVVVSTHQVDDIADVFDRVVILDRGAVLFQGAVPDLLALDEAGGSAERAYINLMSRAGAL